MFSRDINVLLRTLDVRRVPVPCATGAQAQAVERDARRACSRALRVPPLSERRAQPAAYDALVRERMRDLEAILLAQRDPEARALDIVCALCEQSRWAAGAGEPFEDDAHPEIDLQAADMAALLSWAWHMRAGAPCLDDPRVHARMLHEVMRRVIRPLLAHEDYVCSVAALCSAATALILLEDDGHNLGAALRPLLRRLDAACACAEETRAPLEDVLLDACALSDLARLMSMATAGAVDLTQEAPSATMLDELLFGYVQDDWFFTCTRGAARPAVSGAALYRLGRFCGDGALRALGAALSRARALPSPTVTGRLLDAAVHEEMEGEPAIAPRLRHAALEDGRLMVARGAGFFCGLTTGGDCANAGDICVFLERACVLSGGNLPIAQRARPATPPLPDWDFSDDERAVMSVEVTPAYPPEAQVRAHQRTLMLSRGEYGAQLVDVFDFEQPRALEYVFRSPFRPERGKSGARFGPMLLSWEGEPQLGERRVAPDEAFADGQWELTLRYPQVDKRAAFTFFMRHA